MVALVVGMKGLARVVVSVMIRQVQGFSLLVTTWAKHVNQVIQIAKTHGYPFLDMKNAIAMARLSNGIGSRTPSPVMKKRKLNWKKKWRMGHVMRIVKKNWRRYIIIMPHTHLIIVLNKHPTKHIHWRAPPPVRRTRRDLLVTPHHLALTHRFLLDPQASSRQQVK
jgi:hypothetical protein